MQITYEHSSTAGNLQKMNRLIAIFLVALFFSCNSEKQQGLKEMAVAKKIIPTIPIDAEVNTYSTWSSEPYELKLEMKELENGLYDLEISMYLREGAHYVSPNAKRPFKGKFTVELEETDKLELIKELTETPPSVEEFDPHPFVDGYVNWVRVNTYYNQQLRVLDEKSFTIPGHIQFTIEPRCTLEKIPFFIKYDGTDLRVEIDRC